MMFIRLFPMLDKGPNGTHVSGNWRPLLVNCLLSLSLGNILVNTLGTHGEDNGTRWEPFGNIEIPNNQNDLEFNFGTIPKNKPKLILT